MTLKIQVIEPVHVGSGYLVLGPNADAVKDIVRCQGHPIVPGSSIKGACRQVFELLTRSPQAPGKKNKGKLPRERVEIHRKGQPLTAAAALFGCLGLQGRVSFDDATAHLPIEPEVTRLSVPYPPHGRHNVYRFYGDLPREAQIGQRRSLAAFAIPKGVLLETRLRARNVSERDLGGVLLSLGVGHFAPRLGGGKYDGIGQVWFEVTSYRLHQGLGADSRTTSSSPEAMDQAQQWINRFTPNAPDEAIKKLMAKLPLPKSAGEAR